MSRLDTLRAQLAALETQHDAERGELIELTAVEELDEPGETRYTELDARFDDSGVWAEQATVDSLRSQVAKLEAVVAAPEQGREPAQAPPVQRTASHKHSPLEFGAEHRSDQEVRSAAFEAIESGIVEVPDSFREGIERCLRSSEQKTKVARHIIATSREEYRSAFAKYVAGSADSMTDVERQAVNEMRAASLTAADGGYAIPTPLDPSIILTGSHDGAVSVWRQAARVVQTTADEWNGVTSAGITVSWDAEAAEVSDDAPTLGTANIPVRKAQGFVPFSIEVSQDWAAMEQDIRELFMVAKDDLESSAFASASAPSNSPTGLVYTLDGSASELNPATAEVFALADVYKCVNLLPARHRSRASWMADISTYNSIRQFDTGGGGGLWEQLRADMPAVLLGRPAYEEPNMRGTADINAAATADNFILIFGDFSKYVIADRVGMNVEFVPHLFHTANNRPSGQRGLYMWWRTGGLCVDADAFRVMNVVTAA